MRDEFATCNLRARFGDSALLCFGILGFEGACTIGHDRMIAN